MNTYSNRPFIYIAALQRTGSTVLSEALTQLPHAFIFREPRLGVSRFKIKAYDRELWHERGVDLVAFRRRYAMASRVMAKVGLKSDYLVQSFRTYLLPQLLETVKQVGVKEIRHERWTNYQRHFPNMKVIITARDPRDIYLSINSFRQKKGKEVGAASLQPELVAAELNLEFQRQMKMRLNADSLCLSYEDLCTDQASMVTVREFVKSPLTELGNVGLFNVNNPDRVDEATLHGDLISVQRVHRWREEPPSETLDNALQMPQFMPEYCHFWGYDV